jgi:WD40 repeat protein
MYTVAPMFCPPSWLHECYSLEFSHRIKVVVGPAQWETCIRTVSHVGGTSALACWNNNIATTGPTGHDITILDALTGSQTAVLSGHTESINSLTYSLDGTYLVSGSRDNTIKLWDVQTGGIIKTLCGHTDRVYSVSISADDCQGHSAPNALCVSWLYPIASTCGIPHPGLSR